MIRINNLTEQGYGLKNDSVEEISVRHPCGRQTRIVARGCNEVVCIYVFGCFLLSHSCTV